MRYPQTAMQLSPLQYCTNKNQKNVSNDLHIKSRHQQTVIHTPFKVSVSLQFSGQHSVRKLMIKFTKQLLVIGIKSNTSLKSWIKTLGSGQHYKHQWSTNCTVHYQFVFYLNALAFRQAKAALLRRKHGLFRLEQWQITMSCLYQDFPRSCLFAPIIAYPTILSLPYFVSE